MPQNIAPPGLISLLAAALAQQPTKPLVLALDGRCGSGKTTLANTLARQFPASITLHTDDFYLPPAQRIRGWEKTPCANMDLARLRDEALRPAYEGQPVQYRAYSCREGAHLPARELAAQPLVILEGSYSHHPLLTGYETLRVFLTCAKEEQTRRLQAREGERYANFAARWMPLEEGYFAQYHIAETADFVVDTTQSETIRNGFRAAGKTKVPYSKAEEHPLNQTKPDSLRAVRLLVLLDLQAVTYSCTYPDSSSGNHRW